jgi:hypothetical protein
MLSGPSRSQNGKSLVDFRPIDGAGDACICFERIFESSGTKLNKDNTLTQNNRENTQDERRNTQDDVQNLLNNDKLTQEYMQNLREFRLFKEYDFGSHAAQAQTVVCEHTSQLKGCRVWIDKDDERNLVFISETNVAAQEFEKQGFTEYKKHSISDVSMVPKKARTASSLPIVSVMDRPAPAETKIPEMLPSPRVGMTLAAFVVEQFEDRVIDIENDEVFSPIRLWTMEARKVHREKGGNVPSAFLSRLTCYFAVKKLHNGVVPEDIMENQRKLISKARSFATDKEGKNDFWFDTCVEIYKYM